MNNNLSIILSRLLDSYGLDEENRGRRMECQKMLQLLWSWCEESVKDHRSLLLGGSAYETTTIDGLSSDIDIMCILHNNRVIDDIKQWRPDSSGRTYMMDNTGCYKAFVKLCLLSNEYPGPVYSDTLRTIPRGHVVDDDGKIHICSNTFRKDMQDLCDLVTEGHGPALSLKTTDETDYVISLKCNSFPQEARGWKERQTISRIGSAIIEKNITLLPCRCGK